MSAKDIILAAAGVGDASGDTDPYFANTTLLLQGDVSNPNLSYNAFSDASGNNVNILPVGDARGSSFSPYNTSWGVYFDGSSYITTASASDFQFGTGDYTVECWINVAAGQSLTSYWRSFLSICKDAAQTQISGGGVTLYLGDAVSGSSVAGEVAVILGNDSVRIYGGEDIRGKGWTHVAVTRSGSGVNNTKLFVNGILRAQTTNNSDINATSHGCQIGLGTTNQGNYFVGEISNASVLKGRAKYTSAFTPSTSPLGVSEANQVFLACRQNRFVDANTTLSAKTITVNGSPRVVGASPFIDTDTTTGSGYFDGGGDYLSLSGGGTLGSGAFTISAWVYPTALSSTYNHILDTRPNSDASGFSWGVENDGQIFFYSVNAFRFQNTGSVGVVPLHAWSHVSITRDSSNNLRAFVNGVQVGSTIANWTTNYTQTTTLVSKYFGGSDHWTGYISDIRMIAGTADSSIPTAPSTSVSGATLLTLQTRGAVRNIGFRDESEYNHVITKVGNCAQGTFSPFSQEEGKWSVYFDGSYDLLKLASDASFGVGSGNFTIEMWVNFSDYYSTQARLAGQYTSGNTNGWQIYKDSNSWVLKFNTNSGDHVTYSWTSNQIGRWYHIAVVRTGTGTNQTKMYIDGVEVASGTCSHSVAANQLLVGGLDWGANYGVKGYISNFRYSNVARSISLPSAPYSSDVNTLALLCQSNRFVEKSSNKSITGIETASVQPFSPFAPSAAYDPDVNGGSVYLDGSASNRLTIPDNDTAFAFGTSNYTVEAWVYPFNAGVASAPILNQSTGGATSDSSFYMSLQSDGVAHYVSDGTGWDYNATNSSLSLGRQWNHVAWVRNGAVIYCFVNGVQQASATVGSGFALGNSSRVIEVGAQNATGYFTGFIHGLKVTRGSALYTGAYTVPTAPPTPTSDTSLLLNFTNAGVIDATGRNVIETVGNAHVETSVKKYGTGALEFNGTTDELVIQWSEFWTIGAGDYTVECWLKTTDAQGEIVGAFNSASPYPGWLFGVGFDGADGKLQFYNANSSVSETKKSTATVNNGNWNYVVMSKQGSTVRFYINGSLDSTHALSYVGTGSGQPIRIARDPNPSPARYLAASIDDLRITRGVARYTGSTHDVPTKSLPNQ